MNAFEEAWVVLKALPEQQLVSGDTAAYGHLMDYDEDYYDLYGEIPPGSYANLGTIHPAALGAARRQQAKQPVGTVQVQRLERPHRFNAGMNEIESGFEYGIQERTGSPEPMPHNKRNVEDIDRYGANITNLGGYKISPRGGRIIDEEHADYRVKPDYPLRDPIYLDTPLRLEGGM